MRPWGDQRRLSKPMNCRACSAGPQERARKDRTSGEQSTYHWDLKEVLRGAGRVKVRIGDAEVPPRNKV